MKKRTRDITWDVRREGGKTAGGGGLGKASRKRWALAGPQRGISAEKRKENLLGRGSSVGRQKGVFQEGWGFQ